MLLEVLDRIYRINRIFGMENRRSRRETGVAIPRIEPPAALASLGGYPDRRRRT